MVYESDFYTTRRPYSRPLVSSYSVTLPVSRTVVPLSAIIQSRNVHYIPYVGHKRLVTIVHTPVHTVYHAGQLVPIRVHSRVRPSVLAAELNRIRYLVRPSTQSYTEKYLNSKDSIYFDDEAREIRARVDSLLRRVHVFVPRAVPSDFVEEIVPERMRSHDYVRRLLTGRNNMKKDMDVISWYDIPDRGNFGNLACVKYVAGKPQPVRKSYYKVADLRPSDIRNDVNLLSYYSKNRQAAANALKQDKIDAMRRAQEYLARAAEEAKTEEERRQEAETARLHLEMEERKTWEGLQLDQERKAELEDILDQERALAERKVEEERDEKERLEDERKADEQRQIADAKLNALLEEQERMVVEQHMEEIRKQQEREDRLAQVVNGIGDCKDADRSTEDMLTCEITDQEREEKPFELIADDETQIEEENIDEPEELPNDPFVEEPDAGDSQPVPTPVTEDAPKIEEVTSGGEETFEWGDEDA